MPRVKIGHAHGVTVEIEATEASAADLETLAMKSYKEANTVDLGPPQPGIGFTAERRWTPDHRSTRFGPGRVETDTQ